jgi:hypothetical protein
MDKFLEKITGWELGVGNAPEELHYYSSAEMQQKTVVNSSAETRITWRGHPVLGEGFEVVAIWCKDGNSFWHGRFSYSGYSYEKFVEQIHFPIVKAGCEKTSGFLFGGSDTGVIWREQFAAGTDFSRSGDYRSMQFSALLNENLPSVYFDHRDSDWNVKGYFFSLAENGTVFTYKGIHYVPNDLPPLAEYAIPYENVCGTFRGGWFEAGQIYKKWGTLQSWNAERKEPNPLREIGLWVWNRGLISEVAPPVKQLQKDCGEAKVALDWYWWHANQYDSDYPEFWPPREGEDKFRDAVADLKKDGVFTQVYINGMAWDMDGETWQEGGEESVVILRDGTPMNAEFNRYNHHRLAYMCGVAPKFHDKISVLVKKLHGSGLDGQYLDMIGGASQRCCYSRAHGHSRGGGNYMVRGYRKLLARLKKENPDFPLSSEYCNESYLDLFDGAIACGSVSSERFGKDGDYVPLFTSVYHGKLAVFGSYAHVDGVTPWDPLWPPEDRWQEEKEWHKLYPEQFPLELSRAVVWGIQPMVCNLTLCHCQEPEFAGLYRFIIDTAKFYHANREYLFDGTMLSPDGFKCDEREVEFMVRTIFTKKENSRIIKKAVPAVLHSCWQAPSGEKVLFAVNYTGAKQRWEYLGKSGVLMPQSWLKQDLAD